MTKARKSIRIYYSINRTTYIGNGVIRADSLSSATATLASVPTRRMV